MAEFNNDFEFKNKPDETTPLSAENLNIALKNTRAICSDTAGSHNAIFRGKDVTNYFDDGSLWTRISEGTFDDLFVGDYIKKNDTIYRIAGFDLYLNKCNNPLFTHHAVIVPDKNISTGRMNDSNSTENGVISSEMYTTTLPSLFTTIIEPIFGDHVIEYEQFLTSAIHANAPNRTGSSNGASSSCAWLKVKLSLLNEPQVFGCVAYASSGFDIGLDNTQFPLFRLAPEFVSYRGWYWIRNIVTASAYGRIGADGSANFINAINNGGIRPYFLID